MTLQRPRVGSNEGHPRVVALGGGHGTAVTLRALRKFTPLVTAVVSVADDGGSTGRLRELLDVVALGDLRKCLVALAEPSSTLARAFEYRFEGGELSGHALGNLILAGLIDAASDLQGGIDAAATLLGAEGRVLPATTEKVVLKAISESGEVAGQAAVAATGRITRVSLVPHDAVAPAEVITAIDEADQVVIGPGSLYTSILAAVSVPGIVDALNRRADRVVYVANLHPQLPETAGYDVSDHVRALKEHGVTVETVLCDTSGGMEVGVVSGRVVDRALAGSNGLVHDPDRLGSALSDLLRWLPRW